MTKKMKNVAGFVMALAALMISGIVFWWAQRIPSVGRESPPSSAELYHNLNRLWKRGDFNMLDAYVNKLRSRWDNYLPVQLVLAKYYYFCEVDIDKTVQTLNTTHAALTNTIHQISPLFADELEGVIYRFEDLRVFFNQRGYNKKFLFTKYNPRTMDPQKRGKSWMDENLFFNTPEILVTHEGIRPVKPASDSAPSLSNLKDMQEASYADHGVPIRLS